jgi:hypothetical protein
MCSALTQFCLYPIQRIAKSVLRGGIDGDDFDASTLPLALNDGAAIEDVSSRILDDEFEFLRGHLSDDSIKQLRQIKYAIVHRAADYEDDGKGGFILSTELLRRSENIVAENAALLRLIRPTSQKAQMISGAIRGDGTFSIRHLNDPLTFVDAPQNQKYFTVRTSDIQDLAVYGSTFRKAMHDPNWKFRMAVQMHEAGYFQNTEWKARYFLWSAAVEALFTSKGTDWQQNSGSLVVGERVKDLLGPKTQIYSGGELPSLIPNPNIAIEDIIGEISCLRNHIAHGDKVPDYYFNSTGRDDANGPVPKVAVLIEALSFLVRMSLLKIMKDGLLPHFSDDTSLNAYYRSKRLRKADLQRRGLRAFSCPT